MANLQCLQIEMQDTSFIKPAEEILSCSRPSMDSRRLKPPTDILKCPRCESYNTKFCYYNNYSLSQPRHFCKNCRRYWTKGGALRNVPVGGGCRKNKRSKQRVMSSSHEEQPINSETVNPISSALPDNPSVPAAHYSAFYRLPMSEAHEINLSSLATAQATLKLSDQVAVSSSTSPAGFFGTSTQGSVPSLSQLSGLMGLDFTAAIRHEHGNSGLGDFSAPLNDVNHDLQWRLQQRKLLPLQKEVEPLRERQVLLAMSSEQNQKVERVKNLAFVPQCLKMEDGRKETDDWNCGQGGGVFEGIGEQNYWNNNGPWSDFCAYNPSAHTLL